MQIIAFSIVRSNFLFLVDLQTFPGIPSLLDPFQSLWNGYVPRNIKEQCQLWSLISWSFYEEISFIIDQPTQSNSTRVTLSMLLFCSIKSRRCCMTLVEQMNVLCVSRKSSTYDGSFMTLGLCIANCVMDGVSSVNCSTSLYSEPRIIWYSKHLIVLATEICMNIYIYNIDTKKRRYF